MWCNFSDGFDQFRKFDKGSCRSKTSLLLFHLNNIKRGPIVGRLEKWKRKPHSCSKTSLLPDCERQLNVTNKELSLSELTFESECVGACDTMNDELKMGFKAIP